MVYSKAGLRMALTPIRALLAGHWALIEPLRRPHLSHNMCRVTTAYLYWLFQSLDLPGWLPCEGIPTLDDYSPHHNGLTGGILTPQQHWKSHSWLEHEHGWILDLTADQFGYQDLIITQSTDPRYLANLSRQVAYKRMLECHLSQTWLAEHRANEDSHQMLKRVSQALSSHPQMELVLPFVRLKTMRIVPIRRDQQAPC